MKYFGPTPAPRDIEKVAPPEDASCFRCDESIEDGDSGYLVPHMGKDGTSEEPWHRECFLRSIFGSVAHQKGECYCFGGEGEDDPNLTVRENARESERYFLLHPPKEPK